MSSATTTRRAILAGIAATPAITIPAAAQSANACDPGEQAAKQIDPIFAAIERFWKTWNALSEHCDREERLEASLPSHLTRWAATVSEREPPKGCADAPEWIDHQMNAMATSDEHNRATIDLLSTVPTTLAGLHALLQLVQKYGHSHDMLNDIHTGEYDPATGDPLYHDTKATYADTVANAVANFA